MDGVLLEGTGTPSWVYAAGADVAVDELLPEDNPPDEDRRLLRTCGFTDELVACCDRLGIDAPTFWRLKDQRASAIEAERIRSGERGLYDDVDAIRDLVASRPSALVSNNRAETVSFVADHFDLGFDVVRGREPTRDAYERRKPRPDFLEAALEELDADAGVYVGDRHTDVEAAERAGLEAVFVERPHNRDVELPTTATVVSSLIELHEHVS